MVGENDLFLLFEATFGVLSVTAVMIIKTKLGWYRAYALLTRSFLCI